MNKKKTPQVVQFEAGDSGPLIVSSKNIEKIVNGYSAKTASNDRSRKRGPVFYMVGCTPYYKVSELIKYFTQNRVETTDDISH